MEDIFSTINNGNVIYQTVNQQIAKLKRERDIYKSQSEWYEKRFKKTKETYKKYEEIDPNLPAK